MTTTPNNFSEYYKKITNSELLSILDNPKDYQPTAIEAAKNELASRNLSGPQIREARQLLIAKQLQKEKAKEKVKAVENKIKEAGHTLLDTINPIQTGIDATEKNIRLLVIVFGGIFLYELVNDFRTHIFYLSRFFKHPFESSMLLLPLMLLLAAVIMFWKRKRSGWILLMAYLVFSAIGVLWILIQPYTWNSSGLLGNLIPRPSPTTYIFQVLFLGGTIFVLCKPKIREVFSIDQSRMNTTIGVAVVITFILIFMISSSAML
jgi:hypothetical protein